LKSLEGDREVKKLKRSEKGTGSERERVRNKTCERESEKEGWMMWNYVNAGILTWKDLERLKKILSAPAFSLYYRL
jgi:hypothetical protein